MNAAPRLAVVDAPVIRRTDGVRVLKRLHPLCREAAESLNMLSTRFSVSGWKDLFVHFWQMEAKSVSMMEWKLRELGEPAGPTAVEDRFSDPEEDTADPFLADKALLVRCIQQYSQIVPVYTDIRRVALPFDIRMILQRQQLQTLEILGRLNALYSSYFQDHHRAAGLTGFAAMGLLVMTLALPCRADIPAPANTSTAPLTHIQISNSDIKAHREAVRIADQNFQEAQQRYGTDSTEARDAKQKLDEEHRALERTLFESGKVRDPVEQPPVPLSSGMDSGTGQTPRDTPPAHQVEF